MFRRRALLVSAIALFALAPANTRAQGLITTVAGTGFAFPSQPLPAVNAPTGRIDSIALDSAGNIYVPDQDNFLILKITPGGIMSVVAGNRIYGFSGDGGPATSASISSPDGIAVDNAGNVYFSDTSNYRVRKVAAATGIITTVAGTGAFGFSGDNGPATKAMLNIPTGLAIDSFGNLFISDAQNERIRKVAPDGTITTYAGNGNFSPLGDGGQATSATLNQPAGLAVDKAGNLYIADTSNYRIRKVTIDGTISTVAGNGVFGSNGDGGPALKAAINQPRGVAVDSAGRLYIAETQTNVIRKVTTDETIVTIAGTETAGFDGDGGPAAAALLNQPSGIAVDPDGNVLVADTSNARVRKIAFTGFISTISGNGQFNFAGDKTPATSAAFNGPQGVAIDAAGDLYISDTLNNRIRRVGTDGQIDTIAGDGACCFSGDGGDALRAHIYLPEGLAFDKSGNLLFADSGNNRIRRITPNGIISTVAGSGANQFGGFSGDGGQATAATLRVPSGVAVDPAGNILVVDYGNNRIRKITSDGLIRTIAGDGRQLYAGDGGQASAASLYGPYAIALDTAGNLFIAESNNRIRKIDAAGVITTLVDYATPLSGNFRVIPGATGIVIDPAGNLYLSDRTQSVVHLVPFTAGTPDTTRVAAGNGLAGFSGDGESAIKASLGGPAGLALDASGALYIADTGNNRVRKLLAARPSVQLSPLQLQFTGAASGPVTPAQQLSIAGAIPGLAFSAQSSVPWLLLTPEAGSAPRLIDVVADPSTLKPGSYSASIAITTPAATPVLSTVNITFTVTAAASPKLSIDKQSLSFPFPKDGKARAQSLALSNSGGGTLAFQASAQTNTGGSWLSVSPASGQLQPSAPVTVAVTADPTGLAAGTYTGSVTVNEQSIPVTMTISAIPQAIVLSQTGLSFLGVAQGGIVPPQSFGVINIGAGIVDWKVSKNTLSGGSDWLRITTAAGSTDASSSLVPTVGVTVDPRPLAPGKYYGVVQVDAPNAANSPQVVTIFLQVLAAGTDIGAAAQPSDLVFTAVGGATPGSQELLLYNLSAAPKNFRTSVTTENGLRVAVLPADGTLDPAFPTHIAVQPFTTGLSSGIYQGTVTLQFSDGRVRSLHFSVVVPQTFSIIGFGNQSAGIASPASCTPTKLLAAVTTLGQLFTVSAGWPVALGVDVRDDCGNTFDNGSVAVNFSNGDPPLALQSLKGGRWEATWSTRSGSVAPVQLKVRASDVSGKLRGESDVTGSLQSDTDPPVFDRSGIFSVASAQPFQAIAPGSIISIYGNRLADNTDQPSTAALPYQLGNASVVIAGVSAPLYYVSQNQVNAQIPIGLNPNTTHQLLIQRGVTLSQPVSVDVAPAQPSTFLSNGAAIVLDYRTGTPFYVSPMSPATAGDILVIFCAGLGATNPPVPEGTPSPAVPLAHTATVVQVTIGNTPARVDFAGLSPGFVGLYQVNLAVGAGTPASSAAPLVVSVAGQSSAPASIAIQ